MPDEPRRGPDFTLASSSSGPFTAESSEIPGFVTFRDPKPSQPFVGVPLPLTQPLVLNFQGGSKIVLGEGKSPEGSYPCISLVSPNDPSDLASLVLWVDPISFQPMITLRTGPGQYQSYPLDKKFQSPYDKNWTLQGPAAHIGVPPTPPQNQASK